ncbi:endonuclease/exonuclease/phosphatase family protein [Streptomyces eurocidicus]|uniref:Endonuclease/exonuclease/phosphatase (EEP) superfamily protein YafD n=1 Tax=Streptomyces eurocidicus TaxID=66423 RepID=A0A7W8BEF4_STREU|nr:endonuclease/exonuclease/phosphatase family protein [Streptomyces eurocidicus]MBB5121313.1 endonuclease/exonuclease/phosphatase (EEP) superfamily protein YafD [Streptomyces eurocidicus]
MSELRSAGERHGRAAPLSRRGLARGCAGLLLTVVSVPLACRALDTDGVTPVPQLLAFLPWLTAPLTVALLLAAGSRWVPGCAWGLLALAVTGWFLRPYEAGAARPAGPVTARLRVLSANLEFGGATPGLLAALRRERPDLVSVQECAPATCGAALGGAEVRAAYPYRLVVGGGAAEGSAILSRYPLEPDGAVPGTLAMPRAVVRVAGVPLRFQVAHPMPPEPGGLAVWREELGRLREVAAGRGDTAMVLAGDFNASQDHAAFRALLDTGVRDSAAALGLGRTPSWPRPVAPRLGVQIDHVLVSSALEPRAARFLDLPDTDHRALVVDVALHGGGEPSPRDRGPEMARGISAPVARPGAHDLGNARASDARRQAPNGSRIHGHGIAHTATRRRAGD